MKKLLLLVLVLVLSQTSFTQDMSEVITNERDWSIVDSWTIPGKASGLAWDGSFLYFGIYGTDGDHFYRFDPSNGNTTLQFINPTIEDCFGMTWDGSELWVTNHVTSPSIPATAVELNLSGVIQSTFDLPDHYMSGIAADGSDFWVGTYYPDPGTVYKVNNTGEVLNSFTPPADQIWDICMQGSDLWMVDYNSHTIFKTDQSGTVLEIHAAENTKPSGIVHDGNYLWYVDGPLSSPSTLYKVDLGGVGTPEINIPIKVHNYGTVTIGETETWQMQVENIGNADLVISNLLIPPGAPLNTTFTPPQTITPGHSISIPLTYVPTEVGPLHEIVSVVSTDPIEPSVDVTLNGNAVNSGPSIYLPQTTHDYGGVRIKAFTRWFLEIENIGDEALVISNIESDLDQFIVDESVEFPINIATLNSVQVGIWYNPTKAAVQIGELNIDHNDPANNPSIVGLEGEGISQDYAMGEPLWTYTINQSYDNSPKAIVNIQDITGDGIDDVVVCSEDNFIRCLNGNSSGIADVMWEVEVFSGNVYDQPGLSTIIDIDDDGFEDIIVGTTGGDRSIIAFSGKTGNQLWKHETDNYGDGGWVYCVDATQDYNDDGQPDVLASTGDDNADTGPKRVYCLNALDGMPIWERPLNGPVFSVMGVEDFTADGVPDVIAGASNENESAGRIYGINGSDGAVEWTKHTDGSSVWALEQLDDITNDGVKEIIAGDFSGNYHLINPVTNASIYSGSIGSALILRFEKLEDVNQDGYSDVLLAHSNVNGIVLDGFDGSFVWSQSLADKSWNVAPIDDLNGDDINDVIIGTLFGNNKCYFLSGVDGEELESINYASPIDAINSIQDIVGDSTMEMVAGGRNGELSCFSGGFKFYIGIGESKEDMEEFSRSFPNPFADQTNIVFSLDKASHVTVRIYDLNGNAVKTLINKNLPSGSHTVCWNGRNEKSMELPGGLYIYEIQTEARRYTKRIIKF